MPRRMPTPQPRPSARLNEAREVPARPRLTVAQPKGFQYKDQWMQVTRQYFSPFACRS